MIALPSKRKPRRRRRRGARSRSKLFRTKEESMFAKSIHAAALWCLTITWVTAPRGLAQSKPPALPDIPKQIEELNESLGFVDDSLTKRIDDLMLFRRLESLAEIDKVRYTGPPPRVIKNPTGQGAANPVVLQAYTFFPKKFLGEKKLPLIVFVHGGVHGNFNTSYVNVLRELLQQGYAVLAPEYRGSSGYGKAFWRLIDYGGLETEDVFAGKQWMVENHDNIDADRVGIMGWSHGGMITLMNLFAHPKDYKVGYAGVPVSDLVARMGYKGDGYRRLFSADYHIGKTAEEDVEEYRRRSPAWQADKLATPLLIHTTTNDEDVNALEVEHLIKALTAAGKKFEYKIYKDAPGGHYFNRIDTKLAKESRSDIYRFLAKHLNPPSPVK
jgi:dipeptidyl aminopeptidase/acylaminoacyl peptidase